MKQRIKNIEKRIGLTRRPVCFRIFVEGEPDTEVSCPMRKNGKVPMSCCLTCEEDVDLIIWHFVREGSESTSPSGA